MTTKLTYTYGKTRNGAPLHLMRPTADGYKRVCDNGSVKILVSAKCATTSNACKRCAATPEAQAAYKEIGAPRLTFALLEYL